MKNGRNSGGTAVENGRTLIEERRKKKGKGTGPAAPSELHPLAVIWNQNRGQLAECKSTNGKRRELAEKRMGYATDQDWAAAIQRVVASRFCTGTNDRGWKADFDWMLQEQTYWKVIEGKYDDKTPSGKPDLPQAKSFEELFAREAAPI